MFICIYRVNPILNPTPTSPPSVSLCLGDGADSLASTPRGRRAAPDVGTESGLYIVYALILHPPPSCI